MSVWHTLLAARALTGTAKIDDEIIEVLYRLEENDRETHKILIDHLNSFPNLDLRRRIWCIVHAELRPIWEYDATVPIKDILPSWFIEELWDHDYFEDLR